MNLKNMIQLSVSRQNSSASADADSVLLTQFPVSSLFCARNYFLKCSQGPIYEQALLKGHYVTEL